MADALDLLADLIARARAAGADAADAVLFSGTSLSVQRRLGKTEHVERSEGRDLGLRVFLGQRAAMVSSSTMDPASFKELAERAVAMARVVPEDPYAGLADTAAPPEPVALDLVDPAEPTTEQLVARAAAAEEAALAVPGITNSEGAEAGFGRAEAFLVTSAGFAGNVGADQPLGLGLRAGRQPERRCSATTTTIRPSTSPTWTIRPRSAAAPASAPSPGSTRRDRPPPDCRSSTIPASPVACSAISPGRSTAPRWRAAPRS